MQEDCLFIVMPAYNEEANIEQVVREWHEIVKQIGAASRLVVVNDGSKDKTGEILEGLSKELKQLNVLVKENSGHGATILYGYRYSLEQEADFIFQTDSDGQTLPQEFWKFWEQRGEHEVFIGKRLHRGDGLDRCFVSRVLRVLIAVIFGVRVEDANTPFRLMKKEILAQYIKVIPEDYFLSNVMLSVLFAYYQRDVVFLPITFRNRQGGKNSIDLRKIVRIGWRSVGDFVRMKRMLREIERRKCTL